MSTSGTSIDVEPANPLARVVFAALIVLLGVAVFASDAYFERISEWISADPDLALERVEQFIAWVAVASLPLLIAGVLIFRTGLRSVTSERFPPRGMWVLVDTPVVTGRKARWRGRMMLVGAILMCGIAIVLPAGLWYIIHSIADSA